MALRGQYTFDAINQIARHLSGIPGRKNLIWFSGSFPAHFPPEPHDPDLFRVPSPTLPPSSSLAGGQRTAVVAPDMFDFTATLRST